jgi:hypothetical protein
VDKTNVAVADWAKVPIVQVPPLKLPAVAVYDSRVNPAGKAALTETLVAGMIPLFLISKVYTKVSPTSAVLWLTDIVKDKSVDVTSSPPGPLTKRRRNPKA